MKPIEPVILFRQLGNPADQAAEIHAAREHFRVEHLRTKTPPASLVIGRYAMLPHYRELAEDLAQLGAEPANSTEQHNWIASFDWYERFKPVTPQTWTEDQFVYAEHKGPFVVKGATNSQKWMWDTHMFAPNKPEAIRIASELRRDSLIGTQPLVFREYVPLKHEERSITGVPFAHEFRFFFWNTSLLAYGYYWSPAERVDLEPPPMAITFALELATIAAEHTRFFVLDIAETEAGDWILIEINDGQQAGLCEVDPGELYSNLHRTVVETEAVR